MFWAASFFFRRHSRALSRFFSSRRIFFSLRFLPLRSNGGRLAIGALRLVPAFAAAAFDPAAAVAGAPVVVAGGGGTSVSLAANPADTAGIGIGTGTGTGTAIEIVEAMAGALLLAFAAAG